MPGPCDTRDGEHVLGGEKLAGAVGQSIYIEYPW